MTVLLPSFLADGNWFFLALIVPITLLGLLLHPRWYIRLENISTYNNSNHFYVLLGLLVVFSAILVVLGISLEIYHSRGCPNSVSFHSETETLARFVYELCTRHKVPYWTAFGNLLFVIRGYDRIPVGDTDSDIGIVKTDFIKHFGSFRNFSMVVQEEASLAFKKSVYVVYHAERELVQIYFDKEATASHADIWLYRQEVDKETGIKWLVNDDRTIRSKWLLYDQVLPLHDKPVVFLNVTVTVPRNASYLARAEYGPNYMTPITMRMECIENMLNGYTFYKTSFMMKVRYVAMFVVLTAIVTLLATNYIPPLRRAMRIKMRVKARALEAAQRGSDKYFV
ncbi:unnamed protein product [Peronospora belbahrii]|uniref:Transmembrane protein 231 n=2 Tax=Peronospora belbahrii TaxID=622444 RepID=A0ABN8CR59_9STRA|nr:unnamed protein product [Peronospora belbahrii]